MNLAERVLDRLEEEVFVAEQKGRRRAGLAATATLLAGLTTGLHRSAGKNAPPSPVRPTAQSVVSKRTAPKLPAVNKEKTSKPDSRKVAVETPKTGWRSRGHTRSPGVPEPGAQTVADIEIGAEQNRIDRERNQLKRRIDHKQRKLDAPPPHPKTGVSKEELVKRWKAKQKQQENKMNSYDRIYTLLLIEARMTQKQTRDEAGEVVGEPEEPSGLVSGKGYNYKRVKKAIRRAEKLKAQKVSDKDMDDRTSATGVAGSVPSLQGLKDRSRKQGRGQDIEGMAKQMKKDPDAFAPPTRFSPDSRNPHHQKYTQIGGRTRQAIHRRVNKKPMDMLTLPSERHAGSAKRAEERWAGTDKKARIKKALAKRGKFLRGQDHRLG